MHFKMMKDTRINMLLHTVYLLSGREDLASVFYKKNFGIWL